MTFLKSHRVYTLLIIAAALFVVVIGVSVVKAVAPTGYPNASLANCQNKEECKQECINNLGKHPTMCLYYYPELTKEMLLESQMVLRGGAAAFARKGGPKGCSTQDQCAKYCSNPANQPECQAYYIGPLWYWTNMNAVDTAPLWADKIIPAMIRAMDKNIEPPVECRSTYYNDSLSCIQNCAQPSDENGNTVERSATCAKYLTDTGYFSQDDFNLEAKLKKLEQKGETGGCGEGGLSNCFDHTGFYPTCAFTDDPVACFALADKYDLAPKADIELGKKVAPFLKSGQTPGQCGNLRECQNYCSLQANYDECTKFADKNNLKVEVSDDKKSIVAAMQKGESPGQCKDEASCRLYCEDIDHIGECSDFIEKFNLATPDELKEMRQVADAKKSGVAFPGNCKNKASCLAYCEKSANAIECMEFAQKAGFIPKEDAEAVSKIIPYLKSGGKLPGGCTTKESCDAYCASDTHANECVDFAEKAGFMTKEDAEIVKKTGGKGPGNCRSREACDNYCKGTAHIDECVDFAVKAGFISAGDAADAKKYKITSGPGNCKSKADCEGFCALPENQDTCFKFAKDHGMISEEDLKNIEQYRNQGPPDFSQVNPEWLVCMEKEMESDIFGRFKAGKSDRADVSAVQAAQKKCQSEMGPDIRKELEACLSKPTCDEFNSCFDALPKGNKQQQSGQGQQQPQDENGKKVQARASACLQEKMDSCLGLSCSEFVTCLSALNKGGGEQGGQQQNKKQDRGSGNPKVDAKMKSCQDEIQKEKTSACLSKSCDEFDACMKSLQQSGGDQSGQKQEQGKPDPALNAKIQACQKEKINACLSKPCGEFQSCLNSLGGGNSGGEHKQGTPDPAVQAKFQSCQPKKNSGGESSKQSSDRKQQQQQQQQPTQEEIQKQIEEQKKQAEEQIRKQYEEQNKQQYPLLLRHPSFAEISNFILGVRK